MIVHETCFSRTYGAPAGRPSLLLSLTPQIPFSQETIADSLLATETDPSLGRGSSSHWDCGELGHGCAGASSDQFDRRWGLPETTTVGGCQKLINAKVYPSVELMRSMDIASYLADQKSRLGSRSKLIRDHAVFDFHHIPQEPLMRQECKALILLVPISRAHCLPPPIAPLCALRASVVSHPPQMHLTRRLTVRRTIATVLGPLRSENTSRKE